MPRLLTLSSLLLASISAWAAGDPPPPPGGPGMPPPGANQPYTLSGVFENAEGITVGKSFYASTRDDVSAVYVSGGAVILRKTQIKTSGNTSSQENSSFYGLNAAVLAAKGGKASMDGGAILTTGTGANGAFATDPGSSVTLNKVSIKAIADGGHGVMASNQGEMTLTDVDIHTAGEHSAALATDRGGGTLQVSGGKVLTSGPASPAIYSTGRIVVQGGQMRATGAEAAVIEGANSIALTDTVLAGEKLCGVMIYQSFSGDAEGRDGSFVMKGGTLSAAKGPLFWVNNTTGRITLNGVKLSAASGVLVKAAAGRWGQSGSNGGRVFLNAEHQLLEGNLESDAISSIRVSLQNGSTLKGQIQGAALNLDASSQWQVTDDSVMTSLTIAGGREDLATLIKGNGHKVYYQTNLADNKWLQGRSYPLGNGGMLLPKP